METNTVTFRQIFSSFLLKQLSWFGRMVITDQMCAPSDQSHTPLGWRWMRLSAVVQGASEHCYSLYEVLLSGKELGPLRNSVHHIHTVCGHTERVWTIWDWCFCHVIFINRIIVYLYLSVFQYGKIIFHVCWCCIHQEKQMFLNKWKNSPFEMRHNCTWV